MVMLSSWELTQLLKAIDGDPERAMALLLAAQDRDLKAIWSLVHRYTMKQSRPRKPGGG